MHDRAVRDRLTRMGERPYHFGVPRLREPIRPLARVHERLEEATGGLALVSAPAGYGKTTQVGLWAAEDDRPVLWISLDGRDNDATVLMSKLTAMLRQLPPLGGRVVEPSPVVDHERMVLSAVTEIVRPLERPVVVVFDEIHVIVEPSSLDVLAGVVDSLTVESTAVLIGRGDPGFRFGRMRAHGRVIEIEAADLSLTVDEAQSIFGFFQLDVADAVVDRYVQESEGWPVGLRRAAAVLAEGADATDPIARDRTVAGFVRDEWLVGLDDDDTDFLMRASIFESMSGRLCDEVLGRSDSGERLEQLYRRRELVTPLDRRGDQFHMHTVLRDTLDAAFERVDRLRRRDLDRAASTWFEQEGDIDHAVRHAIRARDQDLVERLIARHGTTLHTSGGYMTVRRWLDHIPPARISEDPSLCVVASLTALGLGNSDDARAWALIGIAAADESEDDADSTTSLELLTLKSLLSVSGKMGDALRDATRAYEGLPPGAWHAASCRAVGVLALAMNLHDLAEARLREGAAEARVTRSVTVEASCRANLAVILGERDDWVAATSAAREARQLIRQHHLDAMPSMIVVTAVSAHVEARAGDPAATRADMLLTRQNMPYVEGVGGWANIQARLSLAQASLLIGDHAATRVLVDEAAHYLALQPDATGARERLDRLIGRLESARGALPLGPSALTTAELRVLHLLPTNLTIADIGTRLYVSRNTAKSHAAAVYRKFGVSSRGDAVSVAREVGLLPP